MTTNPLPEPDPKAWARRHLESSAAAPDRAAFLRNLREEDFVPPWRWQQAALVHLDIPRTGLDQSAIVVRHGDAAMEEEQRLRTEIEDFAADFFGIDVATRQQRYDQLMGASAFSPPLQFRMHALSPGLNCTGQVQGGPDVLELAEHFRSLFVLQPVDRARRRRILVADMKNRSERWKNAAITLRRQAPDIVALVPGFLDETIHLKRDILRRTEAAVERARSTREPAKGMFSGAWIVIMVILGIVRLVASIGSNSSTGGLETPIVIPKDTPQFDVNTKEGRDEMTNYLIERQESLRNAKDKKLKKQPDGRSKPQDPPVKPGAPRPAATDPARP